MITRELLSFGLGILALLILALLAARHATKHRILALVVPASLASMLWCYANVGPLPDVVPQAAAILVTELLRDAAWLLVLVQTLNIKAEARLKIYTLAFTPLAVTAAYLGFHLLASSDAANLPVFSTTILWLMIAIYTGGVIASEQAYRNTLMEQLHSMRFLYIGIGSMFTYDLCLYAHAVLFDRIHEELWAARGAITAVVACLVCITTTRQEAKQPRFQMSRELVFYSSSLVIAGVLLMLIALGGHYVGNLGGSWGGFVQLLMLFIAVVVVAVLASSPRTRAHLKVLLNKHLFTLNYDYREEWLRLIKTLTSTGIQNIQTLSLRAISQIFNADGSALWLNYDDKIFIHTANINMPQVARREIPMGSSLHTYLLTRRIIVIDEYRQHPNRYPGLELPEWFLQDDFWLILPLMLNDDLMGFMLLKTPKVSRKLSWEDFDLLKTAGLQIASFLAVEQSSKALSEAKQFDAYSRFTAFIMHDLKNLIAQQSLVVRNAAKHKDNPAFVEDAIETIDNSVLRMSRLLDQLNQGKQDQQVSEVHLPNLLRETVEKCSHREPRPSLHLLTQEDVVVTSSPERLSMIFGHVIRNAQEATDKNGFIDVTLSTRDDEFAVIEVEDNGSGMTQEFIRERLFRPFDTTKSSKGMGIGAVQTREFIRQAGGDIDVISEVGVGTTFIITLPLSTVQSDAPATEESQRIPRSA